MPSPFPGMNPYLEHEACWHDFHASFMPTAAQAIVAQTRPHYYARILRHTFDEDAYLEVRATHSHRAVTAIELVSPSNKQHGPEREGYLALRNEWMLRPERGEPDTILDLKAALDHVYDTAGYECDIYQQQPHPVLTPEDAAWARSLIPPGR